MTGKKMLENQDDVVVQLIKRQYGTIGNYYNEIYRLFIDRHHFKEREVSHEKLDTIDKRIDIKRKELEEMGADSPDDIIAAIELDSELLLAQKNVEGIEQELKKYDDHFNSFWDDVKNKLGF